MVVPLVPLPVDEPPGSPRWVGAGMRDLLILAIALLAAVMGVWMALEFGGF